MRLKLLVPDLAGEMGGGGVMRLRSMVLVPDLAGGGGRGLTGLLILTLMS